jgi:hypothetical protein
MPAPQAKAPKHCQPKFGLPFLIDSAGSLVASAMPDGFGLVLENPFCFLQNRYF